MGLQLQSQTPKGRGFRAGMLVGGEGLEPPTPSV